MDIGIHRGNCLRSTMEIVWGSTGEIDWGSAMKINIGIHNENGYGNPQGKLIGDPQ